MVLISGHSGYRCPKVAFDFMRGVEMAYDRLREQGCQRIGFWLIDDEISRSHLRAVGAVLTLQLRRKDGDPVISLYRQDPLEEENIEPVAAWSRQHKLDGLVAPSNGYFHKLRAHSPKNTPKRAVSLSGEADSHCAGVGFVLERVQERALSTLIERIRTENTENDGALTMIAPSWEPASD